MSSIRRTLHFNGRDLHLNRQGKLSNLQRLRLLRRRSWLVLLVMIAGLLLLIQINRLLVPSEFINALIEGALLVGFPVVGLLLLFRYDYDLVMGTVKAAEGTLYTEIGELEEAPVYLIVVDDQVFPINEATYHAFSNGENYRVYFLPGSRKIISAEQID